jgi:hypothetical protein
MTVLLLTACGTAPTVTTVAVVPTASATAAPSATPTTMPTATSTPALAPTATPTPTWTATPEPTTIATLTPIPTETLAPPPTETKEPPPIATKEPTQTPVPLPRLRVEGAKFVDHEGKELVLKGAHSPHFFWAPEATYQRDYVARDLEMLKRMGGNYVVFGWNSGFARDATYVSRLASATELARKLGFRVQLDLNSRGLNDPKDPYSNSQITQFDSRIIDDWEKLLRNPGVAERLRNSVDIWGILSEPVDNASGERFSMSDPLMLEACSVIRTAIADPNAICAFSGPDNGGNVSELVGKAPQWRNVTVNVHPYQWIAEPTDFQTYVEELRKTGWNISVGEFGWVDWIKHRQYVEKTLDLFERLGISYAVWGLVAGNPDDLSREGRLLKKMPDGRVSLSEYGEFMKKLWSR